MQSEEVGVNFELAMIAIKYDSSLMISRWSSPSEEVSFTFEFAISSLMMTWPTMAIIVFLAFTFTVEAESPRSAGCAPNSLSGPSPQDNTHSPLI